MNLFKNRSPAFSASVLLKVEGGAWSGFAGSISSLSFEKQCYAPAEKSFIDFCDVDGGKVQWWGKQQAWDEAGGRGFLFCFVFWKVWIRELLYGLQVHGGWGRKGSPWDVSLFTVSDQHKQTCFKIHFGYLDCVSLNVTSLWGVPWVGQQTCWWPWSHVGWHVHRAF